MLDEKEKNPQDFFVWDQEIIIRKLYSNKQTSEVCMRSGMKKTWATCNQQWGHTRAAIDKIAFFGQYS